MKTQTNLSNLKKAAITFCSALVITASAFAAPVPNTNRAETKMAIVRLNQIADATEASLKFNAPKTDEETETAIALFNLDQLAASNMASLRYTAPQVTETEHELENLEHLAVTTEAELKYKAPVAEDAVTSEPDYLLASEF